MYIPSRYKETWSISRTTHLIVPFSLKVDGYIIQYVNYGHTILFSIVSANAASHVVWQWSFDNDCRFFVIEFFYFRNRFDEGLSNSFISKTIPMKDLWTFHDRHQERVPKKHSEVESINVISGLNFTSDQPTLDWRCFWHADVKKILTRKWLLTEKFIRG